MIIKSSTVSSTPTTFPFASAPFIFLIVRERSRSLTSPTGVMASLAFSDILLLVKIVILLWLQHLFRKHGSRRLLLFVLEGRAEVGRYQIIDGAFRFESIGFVTFLARVDDVGR